MTETADSDVIETEIIEETAQVETEAEASEQPEQAQAENEAQADDEVIVTIGEESPPQEEEKPAPEWVRELRKQHRELQKRNRELEAKLNQESAPKANDPGKKPTLEDFDYDAEKFEASLAQWFERKRQADEQAAKVQADIEKQQQEWQAKLEGYGKAKAELKVRDYDDAEGIVQESFNTTQQGVILQGADNPALLVYALGKNPKKAKELASISDPVKFAFAIAKLETQLKVTNRKAAPPPEKTVQGTGRVSGSVDSTLDRLRAEAEKSGDYSKVFAYKKQKRTT